jgi:hypothetical protein
VECVGTLSRAGINVVWQRCAILAIGLPTVVAAIGALLFMPIAGFAMMTDGHDPRGFWLIVATVAVIGVLYGLGRFTRAIVARAEALRDEPVPAIVLPPPDDDPPPSPSA